MVNALLKTSMRRKATFLEEKCYLPSYKILQLTIAQVKVFNLKYYIVFEYLTEKHHCKCT